MTEYDAFGNPVEPERPTAGPPDEPPPTPAPAAPPSPAGAQPSGEASPPGAPSPTPGTPPPTPSFVPVYSTSSPRSRRSFGGIGVLVGLFVLIGVPALIGVLVFSKVNDTVDSVSRSFSNSFTSLTQQEPVTTPAPAAPVAAPPHGLSHHSLLVRTNFAAALREIERAGGRGGRPELLRVEAARIDAQVVRPGGHTRVIIRPWDGPAKVLATLPGTRPLPALTWARVDPAAPQRLYQAVRGGSRRPSTAMTYAALLSATSKWSAFRASGGLYVAGLSGRRAQRVGG